MDPLSEPLQRWTGAANPLAAHYTRFRVGERILLTGHSHQAWPDVAWNGQVEAWQDAAEHVDDKWERAFARATHVKRGFAHRLGDASGDLALGASTHELLVRLVSALPFDVRRKVVTTDSEFHSARRQFGRWAEAGLQWVGVPQQPVETLAERVAGEVDGQTLAAFVSFVPFNSGRIVPHLAALAEACVRWGAACIVDAYHAVNVVPMDLRALGLDQAFILGGGYKYCQLGEGNCFLRLPPGTAMRPLVTGWYAEMSALAEAPDGGVAYPSGAEAFAGSTYDPTSHYRAGAVFDFFAEQGLDVPLLRAISQLQISRLASAFDALDLPPAVIDRRRDLRLEQMAGFLVLETDLAGRLVASLRGKGVWVDARGRALRLGPAPYLTLAQIEEGMGLLGQSVREILAGG